MRGKVCTFPKLNLETFPVFRTYQSFPCTFTNWCWSFSLLSKIDRSRFDHSTSNIIMDIFGNLKHNFKNENIWAKWKTLKMFFFWLKMLNQHGSLRKPTMKLDGYIDVGDGCWTRKVLVTILRCWWRFWPFWSPTSSIS